MRLNLALQNRADCLGILGVRDIAVINKMECQLICRLLRQPYQQHSLVR